MSDTIRTEIIGGPSDGLVYDRKVDQIQGFVGDGLWDYRYLLDTAGRMSWTGERTPCRKAADDEWPAVEEDEYDPSDKYDPSPEEQAAHLTTEQRRQNWQRMSGRTREIVAFLVGFGPDGTDLTREELARESGIPPGTVKSLLAGIISSGVVVRTYPQNAPRLTPPNHRVHPDVLAAIATEVAR